MVCVRWNYQAENRTNEMNSFCFGIGSDAMERVTRNLRPYTTSRWNVCALVRERERNVVSRSQRISLPFRYCCWWWTKRRLFLLLPFKYKCYCIFCSFSCHSTRELLSTTIHEFLVRYTVRSTNIHNRHRHTHTHSDRESHSALTKLFHSNRIKYANITDRKKWILSRWECHQRKTYRCFFFVFICPQHCVHRPIYVHAHQMIMNKFGFGRTFERISDSSDDHQFKMNIFITRSTDFTNFPYSKLWFICEQFPSGLCFGGDKKYMPFIDWLFILKAIQLFDSICQLFTFRKLSFNWHLRHF